MYMEYHLRDVVVSACGVWCHQDRPIYIRIPFIYLSMHWVLTSCSCGCWSHKFDWAQAIWVSCRTTMRLMPKIEAKRSENIKEFNIQGESIFWNRVQQIVLLGLGSPEENYKSRCQLAFTLLLSEHLNGASILARDPVFTSVDIRLLVYMGCKVIKCLLTLLPSYFCVTWTLLLQPCHCYSSLEWLLLTWIIPTCHLPSRRQKQWSQVLYEKLSYLMSR